MIVNLGYKVIDDSTGAELAPGTRYWTIAASGLRAGGQAGGNRQTASDEALAQWVNGLLRAHRNGQTLDRIEIFASEVPEPAPTL